MPLTEKQCREATTEKKTEKLNDGHGLSLQVTNKGAKYWIFRRGRSFTRSLGKYPDLSLKEARLKARELDASLSDEHGRMKKPPFAEVAREWYQNQRPFWKSEKYARNVQSMVDELCEHLSDTPVDKVTPPQVLQVVRTVEERNALEIAHRTLATANKIMKYAKSVGHRADNPAADLNPALKKRSKGQLPALEASEMPEFLAVASRHNMTDEVRCAFMLSLYCGLRPSEVAGAYRDEVDLERQVWEIPASRMKNNLPHLVPLTPSAVHWLEYAMSISQSEFLFVHRSDFTKHMSPVSVVRAIHRMGYGGRMCAHGFRSVFSTTANESGLWHWDWIERQLAHVQKNSVRGAYNRAEYLEHRIKLMHWYELQVHSWFASSGLSPY